MIINNNQWTRGKKDCGNVSCAATSDNDDGTDPALVTCPVVGATSAFLPSGAGCLRHIHLWISPSVEVYKTPFPLSLQYNAWKAPTQILDAVFCYVREIKRNLLLSESSILDEELSRIQLLNWIQQLDPRL
ncbi:hypothetical protein EVAR_86591_1 [Eumeta japonica]|uniref:Uncharacterized protein n=1 Tax=Eumeta variegata TaxID=151549 RepID=A0A4C1VZT8_EUMVA|nr:hypothetical protein EVAR_86591_1 [Eumeta japonica]